MNWGLRNQRAEKGLKNGDFQVVLILSFMKTTLYFSFFYSNNMEKFYKIYLTTLPTLPVEFFFL